MIRQGLDGASAGCQRWRPGRVLLVGGDTVVARALQMYLRKEGYETSSVPEDLDGWDGGSGSGSGGPGPAGALSGPPARPSHTTQLVIIASSAGAARRAQLCRTLRDHAATRSAPILELLGAGEAQDLVAANGAISGASRANGAVDASLVWPFRLREILGKVEQLTGAPQRTVTA